MLSGSSTKDVCKGPSPTSRSYYDGHWADILDIARSFLLARIILEYGFPDTYTLHNESSECLMEAVSTIRKRSHVQLDDYFRT